MNALGSANCLYKLKSSENSSTRAPDELSSGITVPSRNFVMCRNIDGEPTAVYGDKTWNFRPYELGIRTRTFSFVTIFDEQNIETKKLSEEVRYIMFCLIYHTSSGRLGRMSPSTLYQYFITIRMVAQYCYSLKSNNLIGVIKISDCLSNRSYLAGFLTSGLSKDIVVKMVPSVLASCANIGEGILGFVPCMRSDLKIGEREYKQTPIIPTQIYLEIINHWSDLIDSMVDSEDDISNFILCFKEPNYGLSYVVQKQRGYKGDCLKPSIKDAVKAHGLDELFSNELKISRRKKVPYAIKRIQFVVKNIIHLYTGMRDAEVDRLPLDCICIRDISRIPHVDGEIGPSSERSISIISTSTKYTGYLKNESWIANESVVTAVRLAQKIAKSVAEVAGLSDGDLPLFVNPGLINRPDDDKISTLFAKKFSKAITPKIPITSADLSELKLSDPDRDFESEQAFSVGAFWPLSSHQYRRSLAFYAASSGFVSLPSLMKQFKHLSKQMTQYYTNGFQNMKTIFGFHKKEGDSHNLSQSHIAWEFQTGLNYDVVHQLIADVFGSENQFFGGTGSYIEKSKKEFLAGKINIEEYRSDTNKRVAKGELSYNRTLCGGCMKNGPCNEYILGDFTSCLTCPEAMIDEKSVRSMFKSATQDLARFEKGQGEYEVIEVEVNKLEKYIKKIERSK